MLTLNNNADNIYFILAVVGAFIILSIILFIIYTLFSLIRRKFIKAVPIIPSNSIFGYLSFLIHDGDNHRIHLDTARRMGPIVQYNLFGAHRFCVYDKNLVKTILKTVDEKVGAVTQDGRTQVL